MQLSIVTVNYRCWSHIAALLDKLLPAPEFSTAHWEFIVVDNASEDGKLAEFQARYPAVNFVTNSGNHGFANGNNLGCRYARGEHLLFINPDVRVSAIEIRALLAVKISHPDIALLSAPQSNGAGRLQKSFDRFPDLLTYFRSFRGLLRILAPASNPDPRVAHREIIDCDWISGSLILISRTHFDLLEGWDEDFWMYAEDMDLCRRAAQNRLRRAIAPITGITHLHGGASRQDSKIKLLTKGEVLKSAHVYVTHHFKGAHAIANHCILMLRSLPPLMLAATVNVLTVGMLSPLRIRTRLLMLMLRYYATVARTGVWLSHRSVNYPRQ